MFLWILILAFIAALFTAIGIGANDCANSFASVYGSRTLTITQIVILAGICEFAGAVLLGAEVSKTIGGKITDLETFNDKPFVLMYGMLTALFATGVWLGLATYFKLAVSTSHSIIGGVMGFALVFNGVNGVKWASGADEFPYVDGFVPVLASWFVSPLLSGVISYFTFVALRCVILRVDGNTLLSSKEEEDDDTAGIVIVSKKSDTTNNNNNNESEEMSTVKQQQSKNNQEQPKEENSIITNIFSKYRVSWIFALMVFITFFVNMFFIFSKGMKARIEWDDGRSAWVAAVIGLGTGIAAAVAAPFLLRRAALYVDAYQSQDDECDTNNEISRRSTASSSCKTKIEKNEPVHHHNTNVDDDENDNNDENDDNNSIKDSTTTTTLNSSCTSTTNVSFVSEANPIINNSATTGKDDDDTVNESLTRFCQTIQQQEQEEQEQCLSKLQ